jgi:hypothetical protein
LKEKRALKKSKFIEELIIRAKKENKSSETVQKILSKIVSLRKKEFESPYIPNYILEMKLDQIGGLKDP